MKTILGTLVLTMVIGFGASAQSNALRLAPLFEGKARVTDMRIPFRVSGRIADEAQSIDVYLKGTTPDRCRIMRDPHIAKVVYLKCVKEATVLIQIKVRTQEGDYTLDYGPFAVREFKPPVIKGGGGGGGEIVIEPEDPDWLAGRSLWSTHCASCHQDGGIGKAGRTAAQIKGAIVGASAINSMKFLSGSLTDDDYKKLEAYLKSPGGQ